MKVIHLTTVHPRSDVRILEREARSLAARGDFEVLLVVADDQGAAARGDVAIHDVGRPGGGRLGRMVSGPLAALRAVRSLAPDVVHFHDPELIPLGLFLKARGCRVVYDVHEDLPRQILAKHWIPAFSRPLVARFAAALEAAAARRFDALVAATPQIAARFPAGKTIVVQNFPLLSEFPQLAPAANDLRTASNVPAAAGVDAHRIEPDPAVPAVAYVGGITALRGAREMVAAMTHVVRRHPSARLRLAGAFTPAGLANDLGAMEGWRHVDYQGYLDRAGIAAMLRSSRAGLCLLHPTQSYVASYPVKLFEYMAAGLPVIASDFPLWRRIVDDAGCGILVDPLDPQAIGEAVAALFEDPAAAREMGARGRAAVASRYHWDAEARKLHELYDDLARRCAADKAVAT